MSFAVLGSGAWGTALANMLAGDGSPVVLWGRNAEVIDTINRECRNPDYLGDIILSKNIFATADLATACEVDTILCVTPAQTFAAMADKIKAAGIDTIACLSVNDAFVMGAWGEAQNASEIVMVADGNGQFTDAMGLTLDATGFGMGKRSQRYAMIVDNGVITHINVEEGPGVDVSSAETMMGLL